MIKDGVRIKFSSLIVILKNGNSSEFKGPGTMSSGNMTSGICVIWDAGQRITWFPDHSIDFVEYEPDKPVLYSA